MRKRFYNRETIAASNYEIHQMSFILSFLSFNTSEIIKPFLNSRIPGNHDKVDGLSARWYTERGGGGTAGKIITF